MRKKIMNVVLFLAVLAAALGMTLYVGNSAASVLIYNFIFLGIIAVVYIVGLLGGMFRMNKLSLALKDAADELESDMTNMTRVSDTVLEQVLTGDELTNTVNAYIGYNVLKDNSVDEYVRMIEEAYYSEIYES